MNLTTKAGRASSRLLLISSLIHGLALVISFAIYPRQILGTMPLAQSLWQGGIIVAAVSAVALLLVVLCYTWLTAHRRCSVMLLSVTFVIIAGFVALWVQYYNTMLSMP